MDTHLQDQFGNTPPALHGIGGESQVYALDNTRVVRLYKSTISLAYIEGRHRFYAHLAAQHPPFAIPQVLSSGQINGYPYAIEQRMPGQDFAKVLPTLTGPDRVRALTSYLHVAAQIGTIRFPNTPFGELLSASDLLQRVTWPQFLWDRMQQSLQSSRPDLETDVPHFERTMDFLHMALQQVAHVHEKCLVHGDYFPGNVFINEHYTVYGVGDFGYTSVVGDPRMDLAGAVVYLEVVDGYQAADTQFLMQQLSTHYGMSIVDVIHFYRLYYSIYFSVCKQSDPRTYAWCVQNLRAHLQTR